jgi:microcystin-dependent protein
MSDPFIGEIKINAYTYPPQYWALCNGQTLQIQQNTALYSLLGITFGGDGKTTFNLPNLQGRTPVHIDTRVSLKQGTAGGSEWVGLTTSTMPTHTHTLAALNATASGSSPAGMMLAAGTSPSIYATTGSIGPMDSRSIVATGNNQVHSNMQPYLVLNFCIALAGIYPMRP